ncbi:MAG TPA: hypothetical protein DD624_00440 [Alphaproteobacteria bacterium]|nr:hypothetical protein [Alphaproteobacteria bacterium]
MRGWRTFRTVLAAVLLMTARAFALPIFSDGQVRLFAVQRADENRLVLSFPEQVTFTEKTAGDDYTVVFDAALSNPDTLKVRRVLSTFPKEMRQVTVSGNPLSLTLRRPKGQRVKAVQNGRRITISVSPFVESRAEEKKVPEPVAKPEAAQPVQPEKTADDAENISLNIIKPFPLTADENGQAEVVIPSESGYRSVSLSFPWTRMTAAAAFRRQGYLWLVFDRKGNFNFDTELKIYKDIIYEIVQIPHSKATILRLVTAPGYNPSLRREGLLWVVDLMVQPLRPKKNLDLILQRKTPFGPRIFIPMDETPEIIPLIDPEVGDLFYIVPVFALGKGVSNRRSFVDAVFLPSAQGLALVPNTEDLSLYSSSSGLEIRGPAGGMRFSSEDMMSYLARKKINKNPLEQLLDVGVWAINADDRQFLPILKEMQKAVAFSSDKEKPVKRLLLARYWFANGFYPETLGILKTIAFDAPDFAKQNAFVALRGAANFMMQRYREALADFSAEGLQGDDAVKYWKAAAMAGLSGKPQQYLPPMRENMAVLTAYPSAVKTRLALAGLHAAIAAGDEFSVQNFMEAAVNDENSKAVNTEIGFYHSLWQEINGMYSMAQKEMKQIADGTDYYYRAMAGLEFLRMDERSETMTPEQRIEELERLSYAWRGDDFEYNLMTMLVDAYQKQKNYAQMLYTLKGMQVRFADLPESKKIPKLMSDLFAKIYLTDEGDSLPPIKAIALFDEFRDLLPKGERGAKIVRRLADRLIAIDLPDKAAELLEQQLTQPIGNTERGLVATRLALVRLLNREPAAALKALNVSENAAFSPKTARQRRHIKAKALADLKRIDEAVELLEDDDSDAAKQLRAEIFWQAQIWDKAADALKLLIKRPSADVPLTKEEAQRVLNWAAALRLAGRTKVVLRLRENFMPHMQKTDLAQAFDFITTAPQQGVMDYRRVADEVKAAENFNTFAKGYIDLLKTKGLSEAVQ